MKKLYFVLVWEVLFLVFSLFVVEQKFEMFLQSPMGKTDWLWLAIVVALAVGCWLFSIPKIKNIIWTLRHPRTGIEFFNTQTEKSIASDGGMRLTHVKRGKKTYSPVSVFDLDTSLWKKRGPRTLVSKRNKKEILTLPKGFEWCDPNDLGIGKIKW